MAIIKHANPCGIAVSSGFGRRRASQTHECDPLSAFGGVIAAAPEVTVEMAEYVSTIFTEVIVAPAYAPGAVDVLARKKNVRVLVAAEPMDEGCCCTPSFTLPISRIVMAASCCLPLCSGCIRLKKLYADGGYQGAEFQKALAKLLPQFETEIVKRSDQAKGFVVLPRRWVVERTIAWLNRCRRLAKDWENLNRKALAFLRLASIRLMLRKLCNPA